MFWRMRLDWGILGEARRCDLGLWGFLIPMHGRVSSLSMAILGNRP
jgi:hypothetical protein